MPVHTTLCNPLCRRLPASPPGCGAAPVQGHGSSGKVSRLDQLTAARAISSHWVLCTTLTLGALASAESRTGHQVSWGGCSPWLWRLCGRLCAPPSPPPAPATSWRRPCHAPLSASPPDSAQPTRVAGGKGTQRQTSWSCRSRADGEELPWCMTATRRRAVMTARSGVPHSPACQLPPQRAPQMRAAACGSA